MTSARRLVGPALLILSLGLLILSVGYAVAAATAPPVQVTQHLAGFLSSTEGDPARVALDLIAAGVLAVMAAAVSIVARIADDLLSRPE